MVLIKEYRSAFLCFIFYGLCLPELTFFIIFADIN